MKKNFSVIGLAGFVSERHVKAIKETNNDLISGMDYHDNVGFLDYYYPNCNFFTNYKNYAIHLKKNSNKINYLSICTPNYLHKKHIELGIKNNINVICEKPLTINFKNLLHLKNLEKKSKKKISCILQLRLHKEVKKIVNKKKKN